MNDVLERELEAATQKTASIRNVREKFIALAENGDREALAHVRELEAQEVAARERIKQLHFGRMPLASA